jgi:hypothetical protein
MTISPKSKAAIAILGLVVTIAFGAYMAVTTEGQEASIQLVDLTGATTAEVRDGQGQVVLRGQFVAVNEEDEDFERKAALEPANGQSNATGEAEVEFAKVKPTETEVEFTARNLQAAATYAFIIDGHVVATAAANRNGQVEVEVKVKMP